MFYRKFKVALMGCASAVFISGTAHGASFDIPAGSMDSALQAYMAQSGVQLFVSDDIVKGLHTNGVKGNLTPDEALSRLLNGSGLSTHHESGAVAIVAGRQSSALDIPPMRLAQAAPPRASVETVTVTSSKLGGADVQSIPIAITALSQEQLTATQTAGGPDLVKQVPNLTFTKTNFSGYSIQIRGIGTQAISVTTDPAVAVALNDVPFIRNHFFEQEFFDLSQAEVLRGPQGTLYGRNATAGVVNLVTAKPTDQFEAMASADIGNYKNRRFEGMINLPLVDDRLDLRVAGEWTKRNGYTNNQITGSSIDGRDLWSSRVTLAWKPSANIRTWLVWEHFQEDDDRLRSGKQTCKRDPGPSSVDGVAIDGYGEQYGLADALSQGCLPASLYSPEAFQTPNGQSLPFYSGLNIAAWASNIDPYASTVQSSDLRVIESVLTPSYKAKNDVAEFNADFDVTPQLTFTSQTGYNRDFLYSTEDYNRFNTAPGVFQPRLPAAPYPPIPGERPILPSRGQVSADDVFCDPQLGCSDRLVGEDLNTLHSWQLSQEFRVASHFSGPFNFSAGGNFLHYEIDEDYYVFLNSLTLLASQLQDTPMPVWQSGVSDNHECLGGYYFPDPAQGQFSPLQCGYIDPNPISNLNGNGHNYFRSNNPYVLNSYATFGEAYYNVAPDLKLTGGLRWTDDRKHFVMIPSELLVRDWGYPVQGTVDQVWSQVTGRAALDWTPRLDFTDQTLIYGSIAHGYKAGGANPPGAILLKYGSYDLGVVQPVHPLTFKPEFINAYELGNKNTLLDGSANLNITVFHYDYSGYQISQIVDRTSVNFNIDAKINGAEIEAGYEPIPGLKFKFAGGYESTRINNGQSQIDLMDRTAGHAGWLVLKPTVTQASNCIIPAYVVAAAVAAGRGVDIFDDGEFRNSSAGIVSSACQNAYDAGLDPLTGLAYRENPSVAAGTVLYPDVPPGYVGFDPVSGDPNAPADVNNGLGLPPNNGEGFAKNLGGNQLPNSPHFTTSLSAEYTAPVSEDWAATLHGDFYWQSQSFARVFNDRPYDQLRGYTNFNLALILTSAGGWQAMGYVKNIFDVTAITGDFLNSDDSGLTTNVFLTDPRLFGIRVTKNW